MAPDDFDVVEYKVLAFLYQSIKDGVKPTYEKAAEVAKVNPVYWDAVIGDLLGTAFEVALKVASESLKSI